ncbi:MAG: Cna B-type domain-containing protein [Eubacteriales bacterium]|nr:Cna B-type domain-containing protein [Eubacteriales bacterium]
MRDYKFKTKSMLSIVMVLALMFQIMQVTLGNYEVNAQESYENPDPLEGSGEYQGIAVNKTVTDYADGKFKVKVEVEAANDPLQNNLDVVLLIDKSGSMAGERITKAKEAAKKFVDKLILPGKDNIQLAVVSFSDDATTEIGLSTNGDAIKQAIDNVSASGATFVDMGLAAAHMELGAGRPKAQKLIIFLADGIPTYAWEREEIPIDKELQYEPDYTSWNLAAVKFWKRGYDATKGTNVKVKNKANVHEKIGDGSSDGDVGRVARNTIMTADGYKKLGTEIISLGLGMTSEREKYFMKEASSGGNYYNTMETLEDLDRILDKVNEDIITYKVRNGLIVDEEDFPARVKYGDLSEVQIKVINSATGTEESHTIKKSWVEDFSQFHFSGIYLKPGQKLIITYPAELLPQYRDGGMWPVGNEYSYFKLNANIKEDMKLPTPMVSDTISGSVTVIKTWSEEPSQDIQEVDVVVTGKIMGNTFYQETLKVKKSGTEWRGILDGLTVYFNSNKIEYDIKEVDVPGYQANYTASTETETGKYVFQIHNQKVGTTPTEDLTVKVQKTWLGEMPNQLEVELHQNGVKIDSLVLDKPSDTQTVWQGEFANKVKKLDDGGTPYEYKIVEKMVGTNYSADNTEVILKEIGGGILFGAFTNRNIARVNIPVEKKWVNTPTAEQTPVKVSLYRTIDAGQPPVKVAIEPITLDSDNGFKNVFDFMPVFDSIGEHATGKRFIYSVKEETDSSQFEVSISGDGIDESPFIITNTKKQIGPTTKDIEVAKIWKGQTANQAILALYEVENPSNTDKPIRVMTLPTANGEWTAKFENLPIRRDTGEEIKYSVKEVIRNQTDTDYVIIQNGEIFPIYDRKYQLIESNENGKWIFTNIDHFDLQMSKEWVGFPNDSSKNAKFTLYVKGTGDADFTKLEEFLLNSTNNWNAVKQNLPVWKDGKELTYRVMETEINGETVLLPNDFSYPYQHKNIKIFNNHLDITSAAHITITNEVEQVPNPNDEIIHLIVTKNWSNTEEGFKKEVEITLYEKVVNQDMAITDKKLFLNKDNNWTGKFENLPKIDKEYFVFETKIGDETINVTPEEGLTNYKIGDYQVKIERQENNIFVTNTHADNPTVLLPYNPGGEEEDEDEKEVNEDEIPQGNTTDKPKDKDEPKDKDKPKQPEQGSDTANKPNTEKPDTPKDTSDKEEKIEDAQVPQDKPELPKTGSLGGEMYGLLGTGLIGLGKWMKKKKAK